MLQTLKYEYVQTSEVLKNAVKNFLGNFKQYNLLNTIVLKILKIIFSFSPSLNNLQEIFEEQLNSNLGYN